MNHTHTIKGTAYNKIAKLFSEGHPSYASSEKIKFQIIRAVMSEAKEHLWKYKKRRKFKRQVNTLRAQRGYKPKKKTTKAEWDAIKQQKFEATVV